MFLVNTQDGKIFARSNKDWVEEKVGWPL